MATKQVNIDIIAKDKTRMAMRSATQGVDKLKSAVFNLRNAFIGLGAGLVAKSFLDTSREVENLRVRFRFLFADAQEGEKAFKGLVKFAGQVPFSLAEIQRGSANLAVVSKNAKEMNELLAITGDIATVTGLDFQTTAEQLQRVFSGGIASADLFRERGVRDMLKFQAGVQYSAEQSRQHILTAFRDGTTSVKGASAEMAKTFDGVMSMIGDKFFGFKKALMDSAPFEFIKASAMLIEKELEKNFGSIEKFAEKMGKALVEGFKNFLLMGAKVIDNMQPIFSFLGKSIENLVSYVRALPPPLDTLGVIGFLMLGTKGKALVLIIGGVLDDIRSAIGHTIDAMAFMQEKMNSFSLFRSKQQIEDANKAIADLRETADRLKTPLSDVQDKFGDTGETGKTTFEALAYGTDVNIEKMGAYEKSLRLVFDRIVGISEENKKLKETLPDVSGFLSTREQRATQSMTGMETEFGDAKGMRKTGDIDALQAMADMELAIANDTAMKRLEIADKTAREEKNIRQSFINEQSAILKSGQFQDLKLVGLTEQQKKDTLIAGGKQILGAMAQNNKKAFQLNKALNMAEAIMNTATGVSKALATGNIPMAILIGALGAVQIATIAQQKYQGRRLGGRMNQDQPYLVGEAGPELVVPDRASNVVPNGQLGRSQPVTVNFNISTVDARGFNELLVNSRGTIVNMINSAVNEKGKMAII